MDDLLNSVETFFRKVREKAEGHIWPTFGKKYLPKAVKIKLETLPQPIQTEFYENYETRTLPQKKGRNVTLLVFIGFLMIKFQPFVFGGILLYWWHLKQSKIPEIANSTLNQVLKEYNLSAHKSKNISSARSFQQNSHAQRNIPRKIVERYDPSNLTLENLKEGFLLDYLLKTWQVIEQNQYDWDHGLSTQEFKLVHDIENLNIYLSKESGHLNINTTKRINIYAIDQNLETEILHQKRPYNIISFQGKQFFRENSLEGYFFNITQKTKGNKILAWEYYDTDRKNYLRIEQLEHKNFRAALGTVVSEYEFSDILPQKTN